MSNFEHDQFINKTPVFKDLEKHNYKKLEQVQATLENRIKARENQELQYNQNRPIGVLPSDAKKVEAQEQYRQHLRDHQALQEIKTEIMRQKNLTKQQNNEFNKRARKLALDLKKKKKIENQINMAAQNREQDRER